jgi:thiol peroxidase
VVIEREGLIQFGGKGATVIGPDLEAGQRAPDFSVQTLDWKTFKGLRDTQGKVRIIAAVPSLETEICDRETRFFNQQAASLDEDIVILVISTDLPYTQKRWCGAAGIDGVIVLSDHKEVDFGRQYGCLLKEQRILRRAAFVVNRGNTIVYADYMPSLGDEPNYDEVLHAAEEALGE